MLWIFAYEQYEASLCPGGRHVLSETSKPEHADAYRPDKDAEIRCWQCKADAALSDVLSKKDDTAGLFIPLMLDADVVAQNKLPVPPLPPELQVEP